MITAKELAELNAIHERIKRRYAESADLQVANEVLMRKLEKVKNALEDFVNSGFDGGYTCTFCGSKTGKTILAELELE